MRWGDALCISALCISALCISALCISASCISALCISTSTTTASSAELVHLRTKQMTAAYIVTGGYHRYAKTNTTAWQLPTLLSFQVCASVLTAH